MASDSLKLKVYRLRGCPGHLDRLGAAELLSRELGDIAPTDIAIRSLATNLDPWAKTPTKVGTLMFYRTPVLIRERDKEKEWKLSVMGFEDDLILDIHFLGMTPFNDVQSDKHGLDCIAIAGLASHPFGSWQSKGKDRSFMWIRDELPRLVPELRASIYGYDTTLAGSNSFQSIQDLAMSLIDHIKSSGWILPSAKRLVFLAHSLGGIILKEAFSILADSGERNAHILKLFQGGIFFGVPSQGMHTSHLLTIVKSQTTEKMIQDLSKGSEYLLNLDDKFSGLSSTRNMRLHLAYETKMSPTIVKTKDGSFEKTGSEEILVSKESATRSLYSLLSPDIFPVNENHSDMVKFRKDDPNLRVVASRLRALCRGDDHRSNDVANATIPRTRKIPQPHSIMENARPRREVIENLKKSLEFPGQHDRFQTIERNAKRTFEWAYDPKITSLADWLGNQEGLFWIHGKPGSGKSTLMKFIANEQRTWERLDEFSSGAVQISVKFFFHDRGALIQKSFEGLLRSILHQIIEQFDKSGAEVFAQFIEPLIQFQSQKLKGEPWTLNILKGALHRLLRQNLVDLKMFIQLDALDEYDGQPEFICRLLKDLISVTANSRTKLKILFSSRPWEEFTCQFRPVPSMKLHDHTRDDIENYCHNIVDSIGEEFSNVLTPIIPQVVERANGVFLWVRLVMDELAKETRQGNSSGSLSEILDSIPSNLEDFYMRIIQRIPDNLRWDAYVIFEVLSKIIEENRGPSAIVAMVGCSQVSRYEDCRTALGLTGDFIQRNPGSGFQRSLRLSHEREIDSALLAELRERLLTSTGNLVEIVEVDNMVIKWGNWTQRAEDRILKRLTAKNSTSRPPAYRVQFIHQTVREFVCQQQFKRAILGQSRARRTNENGHTFLAKFYLATVSRSDSIYHLRKHELTTGHCLKDFIDSIPTDEFRLNFKSNFGADGPLSLAVGAGLQLFLEETLRREPNVFKNTKENLLSGRMIYFGLADSKSEAARNLFAQTNLNLTRFLLKNGYTLSQDKYVFETYSSMRGWSILFWHYTSIGDYVSFVDEKLIMIAAQERNLDMVVRQPPKKLISFLRLRPCVGKPLHQTITPKFTRYLLDHGADVNELDSEKSTPLDHVIDFLWVDERYGPDRGTQVQSLTYWIANLLAERGGITRNTTRKRWEFFLKEISSVASDMHSIQESFARSHVPNPNPMIERAGELFEKHFID
ncbi:hypothetical protein F4806DRAFT_506984 [Annulohypoxylon nitens]|nr:hypothetical protein F4806DRAFT_506984 [Annulohypoxylon nitens]